MSRPLVKNGADAAQVRRGGRKVEQRDAQLTVSLAELLATPAGRYVLWTLLEDTHVYATSFDHSGSVMYFKEGERNVGLVWRARILTASPAGYELMHREALVRDMRLDAETAAVQMTAEEGSDGSDD